jgi:cytoskeleton protein RodZ
MSVGQTLRRSREERGMTLLDVAQGTRVRKHFLRALEEDAPAGAFPSAAYARFFLRAYARHLGVEEEPLLRSMEASHPSAQEHLVKFARPAVPAPSRLVPRLTMVVAGAVFVAIVVLSLQASIGRQPASNRFPARGGTHASAPHGDPGPLSRFRTPPSVGTARMLDVVITVSAPCWIKASEDGRFVVEKTFAAGQRLHLQANKRLTLILGNAGGARLLVNGKLLPTGAPGQVRHMTFVLRGGAARLLPG